MQQAHFSFHEDNSYMCGCQCHTYMSLYKVEHCRLVGLPDLDQSNNFVRSTLNKWVRDTVKTYGFDGLRVDTTHMAPKEFWKEYSDSAEVFTIGEVFNRNPQYVSSYQVIYCLYPYMCLASNK